MSKAYRITSELQSDETLVIFILDETQSMTYCYDATISGFNEYVDTLKEGKDKVKMTLTKFNSASIETVFKNKAISRVPKLDKETYRPASMTNLYDVIGQTVKATEMYIDRKKKKPAVLMVIMTDGQENCSKEYSRDAVKDLISEKENDGWKFAYLGANQDAWDAGHSIGISTQDSRSYSVSDTKGAFRGLAQSTSTYAARVTNVGANLASSDAFFGDATSTSTITEDEKKSSSSSD